uniref:uncharacterized protein LOC101243014 isoform X2 n=1 Tax=Ciona intestinalis TaxID=7719 RepID=UPI00089DC00C|nr:uncharacterized protein LOC101243014 isoform X2 [Ciona intestinalis]|eukprot:XP_018671773.1 uncharacterized protein LOC101243014 isoform X2 [Ciona intestinalis]
MLLNSDVARLVLGYLAEENCSQTFNSFLHESSHLTEVAPYITEGISSSCLSILTIGGKTLSTILDDYHAMKECERDCFKSKRGRTSEEKHLTKMWDQLEKAVSSFKVYQVACLVGKEGNKGNQRRSTNIVQCSPDEYSVRPVRKRNLFATSKKRPTTPKPDEPQQQPTTNDQNRRRKTQKKPKRLTDSERRDRDQSTNQEEQSAKLLHNITDNSQTMAVVGATILNNMKKCAQTEQTQPQTSNFTIDADKTRSNQDLIAQMSLESLLFTDDLELGDELEQMLGMTQRSESRLSSLNFESGSNAEETTINVNQQTTAGVVENMDSTNSTYVETTDTVDLLTASVVKHTPGNNQPRTQDGIVEPTNMDVTLDTGTKDGGELVDKGSETGNTVGGMGSDVTKRTMTSSSNGKDVINDLMTSENKIIGSDCFGESVKTADDVMKTSQSDDVTESNDDVTAGNNDVTDENDDVTEANDDVTETNDDVTAGSNDVTAGSDDVIEENDDVTEENDDVTEANDDVTAGNDDATEENDDVTEANDDVTAGSNDVTAGSDDVIEANDDATDENDDVTEVNDDVTAGSDDVIEENDDVIEENDDVTEENDDVTEENDDVTKQSDDVTAKSDDVTGENDDATKEIDDVTAGNDDVMEESDDVTARSDDVIEENDDVTGENDDATKEIDDVTAGNDDVMEESDDVAARSDDVISVYNNSMNVETSSGTLLTEKKDELGLSAEDLRESPHKQDVGKSPHKQDVGKSPLIQNVGKSPIKLDVEKSPLNQNVEKSPLKQDVGKSPLKQDVVKSLLKQDVVKSPLKQDVVKSPFKQDVAKSPYKLDVAKSPLKQDVAKSPLKQDVGKSPLIQNVGKSPIELDVEKSPLNQNVEKSPLKQDVGKSPLKQDVVKSLLKQDVVKSPLKQDVVKSPLKQVVAKSPHKLDVAKSPLKQDVAKSPLKQDVAKSPLKLDVAKSPLKQDGGKSSLKQDVAKSPLKLNVGKSPLKLDVAKSPLKQDVAKSPLKQDVAKSPLKLDVAKSPLKQDVAKSPLKQDVAKSPLKLDVAKSPQKLDVAKSPLKQDVIKSPPKQDVPKSPLKLDVAKSPLSLKSNTGGLFDQKTPIKSRSNNLEDSPAKNTRSRSGRKEDRSRVRMQESGMQRKSGSRERKLCDRNIFKASAHLEVDGCDGGDSKVSSLMDMLCDDNDDGMDVLTAVSLQSTKSIEATTTQQCSPRKLTLRYGLRAIESPSKVPRSQHAPIVHEHKLPEDISTVSMSLILQSETQQVVKHGQSNGISFNEIENTDAVQKEPSSPIINNEVNLYHQTTLGDEIPTVDNEDTFYKNICQQVVSGDDLTSLLNETSVTQVMKEVNQTTNTSTPATESFTTISANDGLFLFLDETQTKEYCDAPSKATDTLKEWLNKTSDKIEPVIQVLPNVTVRPQYKNKYRKLLPKPASGQSTPVHTPSKNHVRSLAATFNPSNSSAFYQVQKPSPSTNDPAQPHFKPEEINSAGSPLLLPSVLGSSGIPVKISSRSVEMNTGSSGGVWKTPGSSKDVGRTLGSSKDVGKTLGSSKDAGKTPEDDRKTVRDSNNSFKERICSVQLEDCMKVELSESETDISSQDLQNHPENRVDDVGKDPALNKARRFELDDEKRWLTSTPSLVQLFSPQPPCNSLGGVVETPSIHNGVSEKYKQKKSLRVKLQEKDETDPRNLFYNLGRKLCSRVMKEVMMNIDRYDEQRAMQMTTKNWVAMKRGFMKKYPEESKGRAGKKKKKKRKKVSKKKLFKEVIVNTDEDVSCGSILDLPSVDEDCLAVDHEEECSDTTLKHETSIDGEGDRSRNGGHYPMIDGYAIDGNLPTHIAPDRHATHTDALSPPNINFIKDEEDFERSVSSDELQIVEGTSEDEVILPAPPSLGGEESSNPAEDERKKEEVDVENGRVGVGKKRKRDPDVATRKKKKRKMSKIDKLLNMSDSELTQALNLVHGGQVQSSPGLAARLNHTQPVEEVVFKTPDKNRVRKNLSKTNSFNEEIKYPNNKDTSSLSPSCESPCSSEVSMATHHHKKRRINLITIPITPSKLGTSPLHMRTPSPIIRRTNQLDSGDSRSSCGVFPEVKMKEDETKTSSKISVKSHDQTSQSSELSHDQTDQSSGASNTSKIKKSSHKRRRSKTKPVSLKDLDVAKFLSKINYS